MSSRGQYYTPRYRPSQYIQPYLDYVLVKNNIQRGKWQSLAFQLDHFAGFTEYLTGLDLNISLPNKDFIQRKALLIRDTAVYFKQKIIANSPLLGFCANYADWAGMAFNLACRETGIISVDVQHGIQNDFHGAYGRWLKVPEGGYELLPKVFWCWSEDESNTIEKWSKGFESFHRPIVGGNPWLTKWLVDDDVLVRAYDSRISRIKKTESKPIHILYTLQLEMIPEWVLRAISQSSVDCFWWIRIHPTQVHQRERVLELIKKHNLKNVELDEATALPLYALLRHMDVHVTAWSTTVIEASIFGVRSIVIHEFGVDLFEKQIRSEVAISAFNPNDLVQGVKAQSKKVKGFTRKRNSEAEICEGVRLLLDEIQDRQT
jgi:hypothetical protein